MLARTLFTTTFFALASFAVASPPGCLLGAVNTYDDPSDLKAVCSEKDAAKTIQKMCGDSTKEALEAFADICNGAGVKVSTNMPTSASATASGSKASATASGSMVVMPSGNSTSPSMTGSPSKPSDGAAGGSVTGSGGIPESTGAAGKLEIGIAAALAGLFAVVL